MIGKIAEAELRSLLDAGLEGLALEADAGQRERLLAYIRLLHRWNRAYNLTAVRDPLEMVPRHLLDSLSVCPYLHGKLVLDAGTGAGLPGIPLALMEPELKFHLLDSSGKKVRFVRQAVLELGLANVSAIQGRMESYLPGEKFATIVSRAVASPTDIARATRDLLAHPGRLLIMSGRRPDTGPDAFEPRPDAIMVHPLAVPFLDGERHLLEIRYD